MRTTICMTFLLGLAACGSKGSGTKAIDNPNSPTGNGNTVTDVGPTSYTGPQMKYYGHNGQGVSGSTIFAWSGSGVEVRASGSLSANMINASGGQSNIVKVFIDGVASQQVQIVDGTASYPINMPDANVHTVRLIKITEAGDGSIAFRGFTGTLEDHTAAPTGRYIEIIGDSISAGYGILSNVTACPAVPGTLSADPNFEDVTQTYGVLAAVAVQADWSVEAWSGKGLARNRTASDTTTMAQLWNLTDPVNNPASVYTPDPNKAPSVVVVNLGTNDWIAQNVEATPTQLTSTSSYVSAYVTFVGQLRTAYPHAFILLAVGPMLTNTTAYAGASAGALAGVGQLSAVVTATNQVVSQLAAQGDSQVSMVQFTANQPSDLGCDYHPNVSKQASMAAQLADTIRLTTGWN